MDSDTSSDIYNESVDEILLQKDEQIDDLLTKTKILSSFIEVLKDRINDLQNIISSNLPSHLNAIIEYL
jgi:hypothetical protein